MRASFIIAAKDLAQRVRDKSAIMLGVIAPLGLALIFSAIIPDTAGGAFDVKVGVVDADEGPVAAAFIENVLPEVEAEGVLTTTRYTDEEEARRDVESAVQHAVYVFPEGFSDAVQSGRGGEVRLIGNVDHPISTQIASAILEGYLAEVDAVGVAVGAAVVSGATDVAAVTDAAIQLPAAVVLSDVAAGNRELNVTTFFSAGMAVFFLFFTVQFGVSSLLEERLNGTLPRLLGAPIHSWSIIGGKAVTSFVLGLVSMIVLAVGTTVLIGADWGNPIGVGILMVCGVLAALGIMAVLAVIAKTPEQAGNWQSIVAVVLGLLGGTFFPITQGPRFLALLAKLTPHSWFLQGLGDLSSGNGLWVVATPAMAMLAFFAATVGLAIVFGRKKVLAL